MGGKLHWLEAMRALAALWVVLSHTTHSVSAFVGPLAYEPALLTNGGLGVDFFFVLSGFIIAFSTNRMIESDRGWRDYASARLIRIYLPYLPIGVAMLLVYLVLPGLSEGDRVPGVATSLLLIPTASAPALSVAWSLVHELIFYAVFSLIFVSRWLLVAALVAWIILIAAWAYNEGGVVTGWWYLANPINLCFFLGVLLFYLTRQGVSGRAAAGFALFGLVVLAVQAGAELPNRWVVTAGFAALIVGSLSDCAQRFSPGRWVIFLGAASYSIYLVHNPVLSVLARTVRRFAPSTPPELAMLVMGLCSVATALAYYAIYERPILLTARAAISRLLKRTSPESTPPTVVPS
jgi:exopolysaccharide production protein ExoZ